MSKFAHLKKLDVAGKTAWLTLDDLEGSPKICLRYAGQSNHGYFNAILKRSGSRNRKLLSGKVDVQMMEDNAADDRELFPIHVITGWEGILDSKGKAVPFRHSLTGSSRRSAPSPQPPSASSPRAKSLLPTARSCQKTEEAPPV